MILAELLIAFVVAFLFTAIFSFLFRRPGPWGLWWVFLLVIFLAAWAGGIWLEPFGPTVFDVAWLPFLFVAFIFALLLAAVVPPERPLPPAETAVEARETRAALAAFDVFFWILIVGLIIAIVFSYLI